MTLHPLDGFLLVVLLFVFFSAALACLGNGKATFAVAALFPGGLLALEMLLIYKYEIALPTWIPVTTASMCAFWIFCWLLAVRFEERVVSDVQLPRESTYLTNGDVCRSTSADDLVNWD